MKTSMFAALAFTLCGSVFGQSASRSPTTSDLARFLRAVPKSVESNPCSFDKGKTFVHTTSLDRKLFRYDLHAVSRSPYTTPEAVRLQVSMVYQYINEEPQYSRINDFIDTNIDGVPDKVSRPATNFTEWEIPSEKDCDYFRFILELFYRSKNPVK
ncbi:hypothetical protein KY328_03155 [Candidatus Woesearchaeota archaeon]|nr:hypothetical protein [Candidatus Woesearchaeota archaeon]MBW3021891.1 hypothetical protein [Candidatus Woesearchaeota archaeon]